ncbi:MAG: Fe-S cluster assembly ATPase SufC [Coriobacteriales bacterium]|nr:Fe-S cluster assembly ATPase SufC [Coriobacteriales bacterium]
MPGECSNVLNVKNLSAGTAEKTILHGINLSINMGETHVLMGPNGAGKSTFGRTLMGDPTYEVQSGEILFNGENITTLSADKRSLAGMFMSYQAPVEIPGVPLYTFLRSIARKRPELKMNGGVFRKHIGELADKLHLDQSYLVRDFNVGFSGGERKKVEMLQLLLLKPKLAILDETDSGLDVDALEVVSNGIRAYRESCDGALLIITHNVRILEHLDVDRTHVMVAGRLVASDDASLISKIDKQGFSSFTAAAESEQPC